MILKRKRISRKYNVKLTRLKSDAIFWCKYCNYYNISENEDLCTLETSKIFPDVHIYDICAKLIPTYILRNYVYVVPKRKED